MKNLKKVLALVMAFAMAFTMMAGAAYTDQDDIQATDAVELLATLNVMTGKGDGMFHPNDTITRAEICRIIYTIRNEGNDNANAYADMQTSFQDLTSADDWAKGYIKHCQSVNLISGRDAAGTIFGPQDPVTGVELAVICLRVLGYDPAKAGIGGESWSTKTIGLASEAGLLKGVNMESVTGPCERQWAAQIMANMLDAYTVRWSTDGDQYTTMGVDNNRNPKVGKEYMKMWTTVGTLTSIRGDDLTVIPMSRADEADSDEIRRDNNNNPIYETGFTKVSKDYSELLGQKVKVLFRDAKASEVIGIYALDGNTVYNVNATGVEQDGDKVKFDGKSYTLESKGIKVINNTLTGPKDLGLQFSDYFNDLAQNPDRFVFVDSDDNGKLDIAIRFQYDTGKASYVSSTQIVAGKTYKHADENIAEDIEKDNWIAVSYNMYDECKDVVNAEHVTGKLTATKDDTRADKKTQFKKYQIDSTWYSEVDKTLSVSDDGKTTIAADLKAVRAGDNVDAYVVNGVIVAIKRASDGSNGNINDVALVVGLEKNFGTQQAKIALFDGTTRIVDVKSDSKAKPEAGKVYQFTVSGGEYNFENLRTSGTAQDKDYYGGFTAVTAGLTTSDFGETYAGYKVDDKANVLLYCDANGGDRKHITGKQFKNTYKNLDTPVAIAMFYGDMDGLTRVGALAVEVETMPDLLKSNDNYAYILDNMVKTGNDTVAYPIWTGKDVIVVTEEYSGREENRQAGLVIGYKSISGDNDLIDDVDLKEMNVGKITSSNTAGSTVTIEGMKGTDFADAKSLTNGGDFDVVSGTTKLWINSDNGYVAGDVGGNIGLPDLNDYSDKETANILYLVDAAGDLEVFVIDTVGKLEANENPYIENPSAPKLNPTLSSGGNALNWNVGSGFATVTLTPANFKVVGGTGGNKDDIADKTVNIKVVDKDGADCSAKFTLSARSITLGKLAETKTFTIANNSAEAGTYYLQLETSGGIKSQITINVGVTPITSIALDMTGKWTNNEPVAADLATLGIESVVKHTAADKYTVDSYEINVNGTDKTTSSDPVGDNAKIEVVITLKADEGYNFQTEVKDSNGTVTTPAVTLSNKLGHVSDETKQFKKTENISSDKQTMVITYTYSTARASVSGQDAINAALREAKAAGQTVVPADAVAASEAITIPEGMTLDVSGSVDAAARLTGGGTVKATNIPGEAVVEKNLTADANGVVDAKDATKGVWLTDTSNVVSTIDAVTFESDIDVELGDTTRHFAGSKSARIVKIPLADASVGTPVKVTLKCTGKDDIVRQGTDLAGPQADGAFILCTVDDLTETMIFEYTVGSETTPRKVTVNFK